MLRATQSAEIDSSFRGYSPIFFISAVLSYNLPFISQRRKTYRYVKGKLIQLLESIISVSKRDFNRKEIVLKWNHKQMILGTRRLYVIEVDVRLSYMKYFHGNWKYHDYVKIWNGFGVKWSDYKTGLRNCMVTLNPSLKWPAMNGKNLR